jgi:hypothetical protein
MNLKSRDILRSRQPTNNGRNTKKIKNQILMDHFENQILYSNRLGVICPVSPFLGGPQEIPLPTGSQNPDCLQHTTIMNNEANQTI